MISTMDISGASDAAWATLFAAQDAHLRNLGFYTRPLANQGGLGPLEHANDLGNDPQRDDQDGRTEQLMAKDIHVLVRFLSLCKDDKLLEIILDTLEMLFSAEGIRSVRSTQITACKERISVGDALLRLTGKPLPIMTRVHRLGRQFNSMIREPQLDRHHGPNI
eukprot:GEMP01065318.1.p1 GENE.GEMP01065318.1~~GEMP01065318.1.p1  ORF type:complete len:164 (+),score=28.23 GEMP01065318.1:65-556(+)